jgi:hypothetical protein
MILRSMALAGGLAGAAVCAQFPEFSQQYLQRLGGAADALGVVVADFDASAAATGLDRAQALAQVQGTPFLARRHSDMSRTITRHDRLRADLRILEGQGPFIRAYHGARFSDPQIARAAWAAYQPAVPVNFAGLTFGAAGFVLGALGVSLLLGLARMPFRRRRTA